MSAPTISDAELLSQIGLSVAVNTGTSIAQSVLYGFFIALVIFGARIQRSRQSTTGKVMLAVILTLFALATLDFIVGTFMTLRISHNFLVASPELTLLEKVSIPDLTVQNLEVVASAITAINFFLADGVVVWRARMICEEQRRLIFFPILLLISTGVTSCAYVILMALYPHYEAVGPYTDQVQTAVWALSLATNVCATAMIAREIWFHRRFARTLVLPPKSSMSQRVMILLVDTGVVYCFIQIIYLIVQPQAQQSISWAIAANVVLVICTQLSAIYPALILVLVALRFSLFGDDWRGQDGSSTVSFSDPEISLPKASDDTVSTKAENLPPQNAITFAAATNTSQTDSTYEPKPTTIKF